MKLADEFLSSLFNMEEQIQQVQENPKENFVQSQVLCVIAQLALCKLKKAIRGQEEGRNSCLWQIASGF